MPYSASSLSGSPGSSGNNNDNANIIPAPPGQPRDCKSIILRMLDDRTGLAISHRRRVGRWPRITAPQTFNEYLLNRILIEKPDISAYTDKARAREMVADRLGASFVPARYLLTDDPRLPWDSLPRRFVVSATHGSTMTIIVNDKETLDRKAAETVMAAWLAHDFGHATRERFYSAIPPRLLVEENLAPEGQAPPPDYKFFCFGGKPAFIQLDTGRFGHPTRLFYDREWNVLPFSKGGIPAAPPQPRPARLDDMIETAATLSQGFDFVRIDLYHLDPGRIVFGEWTFTPGCGLSPFQPDRIDYELGEKIAAVRAARARPAPDAPAAPD